MNIQKLPMRPVICLLLVVLLISTVFSVSAFADETGEVVSASVVTDYTSDVIFYIAKAFVPDFEKSDSDYFADSFSIDTFDLFYLDSSGSLLVSESELYNYSYTWLDIFSSAYPDVSFDVESFAETSPSYREHGSTYYPIPCPQDAVTLSSIQIELTAYPAWKAEPTETTPTVTPGTDSTLSQAVSASSLSSVLDQVLDLLPVVVGCIVGFVAIRKGLSFLESILHSA